MKSTVLISATDLDTWAGGRAAEGQLPRLVRRLVHATGKKVRRLEFRADEGVRLAGWDGFVIADEDDTFVPAGTSVWELGTSQKPKGKADAEYEKRSRNPGAVDPAHSTFVFVTPRRWRGRDAWVRARQAEGLWREVRAYDADTLETWLEAAPATHLRISIQLGKHPEDAADLSSWWEAWSAATEPRLSPDLIVSSRNETVGRIHGWLEGAPSPVALQADTRDEALAFFAAAVEGLPEERRLDCVARAVVVNSTSAWNRLAAWESPLLLVPMFDNREVVAPAVHRGHHVLVPLGRGDPPSSSTIAIPRLHREAAEAALQQMGLPRARAEELATLARRSLMALRRRMAIVPEIQRPHWAGPDRAVDLLPALLANTWDNGAEGDRQILSELAHVPYDTLHRVLVRLANESDPPVRQVGAIWYLVSGEDAWSLLARFLAPADLDAFERVVRQVLGGSATTTRRRRRRGWSTGGFGPSPEYSGELREGLARTLAIMGTQGASHQFHGSSWQDLAEWIVRHLLTGLGDDWRGWASLGDVLPKLAEAAPDVFLRGVEQLLGNESAVGALLADQKGGALGSCVHSGLLWALETLAWSTEHLARAAGALAALARMDPGGTWSNRPENSLREIFLPWHPQTSADLDQRLRILETMRSREPDAAWKLLCQLLPDSMVHARSTARPEWREWVPDERPAVTRHELLMSRDWVAGRLLQDVGESGQRWVDLISHLEKLPDTAIHEVVRRLLALKASRLARADRLLVWTALRDSISHHRKFPDAPWSVSREQIDDLERVYRRLTPSDPVDKYAWLFSDGAELLDPPGIDLTATHAALLRLRRRAARAVSRRGGMPLVLALAAASTRPADLGSTLGETELMEAEERELLSVHLDAAEAPLAALTRGFVAGRFWSRGWKWADETLAAASRDGRWTPGQMAAFLTTLPFRTEMWDRLNRFEPEVQHLYWLRKEPWGLENGADAERAAKKLTEHSRVYVALNVLAHFTVKGTAEISPEVVLAVLNKASETPFPADVHPATLAWEVGQLLDRLEESGLVDHETMVGLEWEFLPVFEHAVPPHSQPPRALQRELVRDPAFFAEVVALFHRSSTAERREISDGDVERGRRGYALIESWWRIPGAQEDGSVDGATLREWVLLARSELRERGLDSAGDAEIGKVLRYSPDDPDGAWPAVAVRDVVEEFASEDLEDGIEIEVYNSRGWTSRDPTEGGVQERELVEQYTAYAAVLNDRWPRTAAMLRSIADTYRRDAGRHDVDAELTEDFW